MCLAAFLPWPMATVTVRSAGTMSRPRRCRGIRHHVGADDDHAVGDLQAGYAVEEAEVGFLSEREDQRVGFELLELAGRLREAGVVEFHALDDERRRRRA